MWEYLKFGGEQAPLGKYEWKYTRFVLCKLFPGWTFEYVDTFTHARVTEIFAILAAEHKAREKPKSNP